MVHRQCVWAVGLGVACGGGAAPVSKPEAGAAPPPVAVPAPAPAAPSPTGGAAPAGALGTIDGKPLQVAAAFAVTEPGGRVLLVAYERPITCAEYHDVAVRNAKMKDALYVSLSLPAPAGTWTLGKPLSGDNRQTGNAGVYSGLNGGLGGSAVTRLEGADVVAEVDATGLKMVFQGTQRFVACAKG